MLSPEVLISPILSSDSLLIAGENQSFNVYLHTIQGHFSVSSGSLSQEIYALEPSEVWLTRIRNQFATISTMVNISFFEVSDPQMSDISIFFDSEITGSPNSITYGVTVPNFLISDRKQWFEIFLNYPKLQESSSDFQSYVFNHELLHALGLEHTFDDSDGDYYLSTDPLLSATPEQTVMSYRYPESGIYPTDFTSSDYNALSQIWGPSLITNPPQFTIYRLFNPSSGQHLFSANLFEIDSLTGQPHSPYLNEGIAYEVSSGANQDLFRFYNHLTGRHFYTSNISERDLLLDSNLPFIYEGSAYKVHSANLITNDLVPVYRFYDSNTHVHLYTASSVERDIWESGSHGWINEGIAWYA